MLACHHGNLLAVSALVATGRVLISLQDNQVIFSLPSFPPKPTPGRG
jgi:hypothetical protein